MAVTEIKTCLLMRNGVSVLGPKIGTCCYNRQDPRLNHDYNIDPVHCKACIDQEANNIFSYRQGVNQKYGSDFVPGKIIVLDLTPNITCNLACKICNENASSTWSKIKQIKFDRKNNIGFDNFVENLSKFDLSDLREINFSGGEPWLRNNIQRYLERLEHRVDFGKVILRFSTNGTVKLNKTLSDFFCRFHMVVARFSLDDIGPWHEYQRHPSQWAQWLKIWSDFVDNHPHNVIFAINRTVGILNISRLDRLDTWIQDYKFSRFGDPVELIDHFVYGPYSLDNLTSGLKDYILESQGLSSRAWAYVKNRPTVENNFALRSHILAQDSLHGTDLARLDPGLYSAIFS